MLECSCSIFNASFCLIVFCKTVGVPEVMLIGTLFLLMKSILLTMCLIPVMDGVILSYRKILRAEATWLWQNLELKIFKSEISYLTLSMVKIYCCLAFTRLRRTWRFS